MYLLYSQSGTPNFIVNSEKMLPCSNRCEFHPDEYRKGIIFTLQIADDVITVTGLVNGTQSLDTCFDNFKLQAFKSKILTDELTAIQISSFNPNSYNLMNCSTSHLDVFYFHEHQVTTTTTTTTAAAATTTTTTTTATSSTALAMITSSTTLPSTTTISASTSTLTTPPVPTTTAMTAPSTVASTPGSTTESTKNITTATMESITTTELIETMEIMSWQTIMNGTDGDTLPPLVAGSAIPTVTQTDIQKCQSINPHTLSPGGRIATDVQATFQISKLVEINDLNETLSIFGNIYLQWQVSSCASDISSAENVERLISADPAAFWKPKILFMNNSNDLFLTSTQVQQDLQILYVPTYPNRTLFFYWTISGLMTTKCLIDVRDFPFDSQRCDFFISLREPYSFNSFKTINLQTTAVSPNSIWKWEGATKDIGQIASMFKGETSSYFYIRLKLKRNPQYYVSYILMPVIILIANVFVSIAMPPKHVKRPTISCTILLAFAMTQSYVNHEIPRTSERILFVEFIFRTSVLTGVLGFFQMLMCCIAKHKANNVRTVRSKMVRTIDLTVSIIILLIFIIICLTTLLQYLQ